MNIGSNYFNYSPNFGAHVKMRKPVTDVLANSATVASGGASCLASASSSADVYPGFVPDSVVESSRDFLHSEKSGVVEDAIPVQSTVIPSGLGSIGAKLVYDGGQELKKDLSNDPELAQHLTPALSASALAALSLYAGDLPLDALASSCDDCNGDGSRYDDAQDSAASLTSSGYSSLATGVCNSSAAVGNSSNDDDGDLKIPS